MTPGSPAGYINYYYYGYVLVGMPVKLLGITPSVAYNLVLPALFSMVGLGAFSIGWNLYVAGQALGDRQSGDAERRQRTGLDAAGRVSAIPQPRSSAARLRRLAPG